MTNNKTLHLEEKIKRAPVFFIGHGSPMNAIETNDYTRSLAKIRDLYPQPKAILMVSAHWMTQGTGVTNMVQPKTIHDFYGFPQELFAVQYPAPGSPELADLVTKTIRSTPVIKDDSQWGLDHGAWAVLKHIFPEANIPVVQLSLDMTKPAEFHLQLGKELQVLRDHGVLIMGSGNVVHNLRTISWDEKSKPLDWALEFDEQVKTLLRTRDTKGLIGDLLSTRSGKLSVPTPDHYYPLLYILGAADAADELHFDFEGIQNASISMTSFSFRAK